MTDQQKKLRDVAKECGIVKGITKKELQQRMKDCVGPKMRGEEMNKKEAWNPKLTEEEEKEYLEKGWIG